MDVQNYSSQDFFTPLCGQPLLNTSAVWDASYPYLGRCVERTILTWFPCLFLCLFAPLSLLSLHRSSRSSSSFSSSSYFSSSSSLTSVRSQRTPLLWSPLLRCKMIASVLVLVAALAETAVVVAGVLQRGYGSGLTSPTHTSTLPLPLFPMDLVAPLMLVVACGLAVVLVVASRRYGQRSSGLLFIFWTLMVLCGIPQLVSTITALQHSTSQQEDDGEPPPLLPSPHHHHNHQQHHPVLHITFLLQYIGSVISMVLHCFAEPVHDPNGLNKAKECPEDVVSFPNFHTYHWVTEVLMRGRKRPLTVADLWPLPKSCKTPAVDARWMRAWRREVSHVRRKALCDTTTATTSTNTTSTTNNTTANTTTKSSSANHSTTHESGDGRRGTLHISIVRVALRAYLWHFLASFALLFVSELSIFISPIFLGRIISFTKSAIPEPTWHGYLYAVLLAMTSTFVGFLRQAFYYVVSKLILKFRASLMMAVYRKTLTISPGARREFTAGEIVNLMSVDTIRISDFPLNFILALVIPCVLIVAIWQLWLILGPSVLAGLAVMIIMMPINAVIASRIKSLQNKQMKLKDKRIKLAGEIINGIKVLKLNAWEEPFCKQVEQVRKEEVQVLTRASYYNSFVLILWQISPIMVSLASFATYILVSEDNKLDAETVFVSIALLDILRYPMSDLPRLILKGVQAKVSLVRLEKFLAAQNLDPKAVSSDSSKEIAIKVEDGTFRWDGGGEWALQGVDMEVKKGELVAVVGSIGAGKSSLLSAFLGQIEKTAGRVVVNGKVALVSQEVWLQNASLRENITWGSPWEEEKYWKVVEACALMPDLDMLPAGDLTEIGEKGINLSGGQKQRVGLARAAYSGADVMLLDDPLSAVDANVGRHIFECLLGPSGLMAGTTRVLVTHALWVLPKVNCVMVIEEGRLVERGTCGELVEKGGSLAQLLLHHITQKKAGEEEEEVLEEEMEDEGLEELCAHLKHLPGGQQLLRQISHHSSSSGQMHTGSQNSITTTTTCAATTPTTTAKPEYTRQESTSSPTFSNTAKLGSRQRRSSKASAKPRYRTQVSVTSSCSSKGVVEGEGGVEMTEKGRRVGGQLVEEEAVQTGRVGWGVYKFYIVSSGVVAFVVAFVMVFMAHGFSAGSNFWLSYWANLEAANTTTTVTTTNNTIAEEEVVEFDRGLFLAGYAAFGIGMCIFFYGSSLLMRWGCLRAAKVIHNHLMEALVHLPTSFFDTNPSGRIMNRLSKEINTLDVTLPFLLSMGITAISQLVTNLLMVVVTSPMVGLVMLVVVGLYFMVLAVYVTSHRQIKRIESVLSSPVFSFFGETVQGVSTIRAFKKQDSFTEECQSRVEGAMQGYLSLIISNRWLSVRMDALGILIVFATSLFAVAGRGTISPGIVGLSITYSLIVTDSLHFFITMWSDADAQIVSVERIKEYMEEEKEAPWRVKDTPPKEWPDSGAISITGLKLRYRPGLDLVFRGLTCSVKAGEKVGIVGRTGAGKSSLTMALFRIVEMESGTVELDGRDIAKVGLHDLRSKITIIPQDPVLFSGTLRFNLDPTGSLSDAAVWHALELAHLAPFVKSQLLGLTMTIDEGGANLSVGQRQLVGLARALLRRSQLLVLDEATAAVDVRTDRLIQATIRQEFAHCTILTIAHRLNTILDSDRVMVLEQGRIAEYDSPSALLACKDSIFHSLARDAGLVREEEEKEGAKTNGDG